MSSSFKCLAHRFHRGRAIVNHNNNNTTHEIHTSNAIFGRKMRAAIYLFEIGAFVRLRVISKKSFNKSAALHTQRTRALLAPSDEKHTFCEIEIQIAPRVRSIVFISLWKHIWIDPYKIKSNLKKNAPNPLPFATRIYLYIHTFCLTLGQRPSTGHQPTAVIKTSNEMHAPGDAMKRTTSRVRVYIFIYVIA